MLKKLTDFISGREPVAGATGLAGLIIAGFGLLDVFEVLSLTAPQVAAIGVFVTALAGWLARSAVTPVAAYAQQGGE